MNFQRNSPETEADDTIESSEWEINEKDVKEKSELLFELNTICKKTSPTYELSDKSPHSIHFDDDHRTTIVEAFSNHNFNYFSDSETCTDINKEHIPSQLSHIEPFSQNVYNSEETTEKEKNQYYSLQNEKPDDSNSDESAEQMPGDSKRARRRNSKRKKDHNECCPICGVTVRIHDLESHYNQEVEKLSKITKNPKRLHSEELNMNEVFAEIKKNREGRLTARVARYSARAKNEVKCPVCSLRMSGTPEEINKHVAFCIQDEDSDETINVDDDDEPDNFEEYEIGDETRIRPISLIPGGYRSLHGNTSRIRPSEDEELHVDVDDTFSYGQPQYSELDVIPDASSDRDKSDLEQLRKAVLMDSDIQPNVLESQKWSKTEVNSDENLESTSDSDPVITSLKARLKDLEDTSKNVKCLICLESYTNPVVSTTCWHVHCEECWMMTMGVKKLCPQCNMIVFPSDLRKIFL